MITLKSNNQTIVNPRTQLPQHVYMHIKNVLFNGVEYYADIQYYYTTEEVIDSITYVHKHDLEKSRAHFTAVEADLIENSVPGGLQGTNHSEKYINLVIAGTMYQLSLTPGLYGAAGWTIVASPVINQPL